MEESIYYGVVLTLKEFILRETENTYGNRDNDTIKRYIKDSQHAYVNKIAEISTVNESNCEEVFLKYIHVDSI